jgi:hypothetical protein
MGLSYAEVERVLESAVASLFKADPSVQSVGIGRHGGGYGIRVVKNIAKILPIAARVGALSNEFQGVPVTVIHSQSDVRTLAKVPPPGSPMAGSMIPEQGRIRPVVCGLQIQNFDDDIRQATLAEGYIIVGSVGCFVKLASGKTAILSNNHVVAGQNRGIKGADRISQPGGAIIGPDQVATLTDFVPLHASPAGAAPIMGTIVWNDVDAGVAELCEGVNFTQGYLPSRGLIAPSGTDNAQPDDLVFKIGRTTGLTHGKVTDISTTVGPIPYDVGGCWFRRSFAIEGLEGTIFSDSGDSGSAVLREKTGEVLGILYAGNGSQTYACPIDTVLASMACKLA